MSEQKTQYEQAIDQVKAIETCLVHGESLRRILGFAQNEESRLDASIDEAKFEKLAANVFVSVCKI